MSKTINAQFKRFFKPIISSLKELGGSGNVGEIIDSAIDKLNIPEDEQQETLKNDESKIRNQAQWARHYLVKAGFISSSLRGVWTLTDKALTEDISDSLIDEIIRAERKNYQIQKRAKMNQSNQESLVEEGNPTDQVDNNNLLEKLLELPPNGFERICQRLLREAGFQEVKITGKTGDGGIDGYGILEINPLVSFNVLFQCKRYKGSVSASQIRDFRGAMQGRADKGIIITTGYFTSDAKKEARRDGAPPIEIVDGEKLVEMFYKLELGVIPTTIYKLDLKFFNDFQNNLNV